MNLAGSTLDGVTADLRDYAANGRQQNLSSKNSLTLNGTLTLGDGSYFNFGYLNYRRQPDGLDGNGDAWYSTAQVPVRRLGLSQRRHAHHRSRE